MSKLAQENSFDALTIAIRHGLVRKQFGPANKPETTLMDYPLHQFRLFSHLAEALHNWLGGLRMVGLWVENLPQLDNEKNKRNELMHGLSSACKAYSTWFSQQTIAECRQALGGLGFSHYSMLGKSYADGDVNQTFEGDNHVMIMQTARFILKNLSWMVKGKPIMETCEYLSMADPDPASFSGTLTDKDFIRLFQKRAKDTAMAAGELLATNPNLWDEAQPYVVKEATRAYYDLYLAQTYKDFVKKVEDEKFRAVLTRLSDIFNRAVVLRDGLYFRDFLSKEQIT